MNKSNYLEQKFLEHMFKNLPYTAPSTVYVSLHTATVWQPNTAYSVGDYVIPTAFNTSGPRRLYRCTTAGTSGASEPSWPTTEGGTVNDGTVVWTEATPTLDSGTNLPPEVSGGGYARQGVAAGSGWTAIADEPSGNGKQVQNAAAVSFGNAGTNWGTVVFAGVWDAASAGNLLYWLILDQAKTVTAGDPVSFPANSLTIVER
ncbi:hypothetical protein OO015_13815 (plasmid) [Thermomicrobium sp. 4228-Ro]|uniref:phage tail fiber protein n=1 Tax=Thermomicrobium sp. 4228-Ro TaxID=2993937 RepID=UPI002249764D|nr:hypothetical protein [Thermomicrobium sp. 4228-Ro]MCX2728562.1 hypothetical protein [Thermomicrobium sp. 4228-Ro]